MFVEIGEVSRHESGLIYIVVYCWWTKALHDDGRQPDLVNDFLMQLVRQYQRQIPDTDPPQYETVTKTNVELRAEVRQNIIDYWRRVKPLLLARQIKRRQDSTRLLLRNNDDSDGILARLAVLRGYSENLAGE